MCKFSTVFLKSESDIKLNYLLKIFIINISKCDLVANTKKQINLQFLLRRKEKDLSFW